MFVFLDIKESVNFFFIFVILTMFFFCLYFYFCNRRLEKKIKELELEIKEILERKLLKEEDLVSIHKLSLLSEGDSVYEQGRDEYNLANREVEPNGKVKEYLNEEIVKKQELNSSLFNEDMENGFTNPLYESNQETFDVHGMELDHFDLNDYVSGNDRRISNIQYKKDNREYLQEILDKVESELNSKPIELTDYELEQEDKSIISYRELLALRDRLQVLDEEKETEHFIDGLKKFRDDLN